MRPIRWLLFVGTFCILHYAFWLFILVRDLASAHSDGAGVGTGILGFIVIFVFMGPITGAEFAIGYAVIDTVAGFERRRSLRPDLFESALVAFVAYSLLLLVLWAGKRMPAMSGNLADSYLGFGLTVPWSAILLGGLSGLLVVTLRKGWAFKGRTSGQAA
jgi:hypothetical protein